MFNLAADFKQALRRTLILAITALLMIFLWAGLRIPDGNLQMVVFAALSAVRASGITSIRKRLCELSAMAFSAAILQYIVAATEDLQLLNVLLPTLGGYVVLRWLPRGAAYPVLLTGFLAYSAGNGVEAAAGRAVDLLITGVVAWIISLSLFPIRSADPPEPVPDCPMRGAEALQEILMLFCAIILYKILSMPQGIWIVLTVIFVHMVQTPDEKSRTLVNQRIFAVPIGILLGGLYSSSAVMLDYRLAYLMPLIWSIGFFMLYYRHDFFSFSLFFMFSFTVCADWMEGTFREFNFVQLLFARSLATVIGAALLLVFDKSAAASPDKVSFT
jgi:hypothetical protein